MKRHAAALYLLLLFSPLLQAQPLAFGEPFPLPNTHYGTTWAFPMLESNGKDFFVFWQSDTNLRAAKVVDGEHRAGRHVMAIEDRNNNLSVTWTGTHFLVVLRAGNDVVGQLLDANAEPVGERFPIAPGALVGAVASNGQRVLVLYWNSESVKAVALTPSGQPTGISSTISIPGAGNGFSDVASNGSGFAAVVSTPSGAVAVTFDAQGREQSRRFLFSGTYPRTALQVAIESDGRNYLAAWQRAEGTVQAAHVRADGSAGTLVAIDVPPADIFSANQVDVAWTGANWAVVYTKAEGTGGHPLRVAYVHATAPQVVGYEDAGTGAGPSLAAANGRTMLTWWRPSGAGTPVASLLPLAGRQPEPVTFAAAHQELAAVASTTDSTLVVWNDAVNGKVALRAGVRSADGDWTEREILQAYSDATLAATDGHDFVVIAEPGTASAIFLDATTRVTAGPVPLPIRPRSIAWTGTDYLIADAFSLARISRGGTVSPVVTGGEHAFLAMASNGGAVMAVMMEPEGCQILCIGIHGQPRFALLGSDLRPIGEPRLIDPSDPYSTDQAQLVWDGNRFVAAWAANGKVTVAEVPLDGGEATMLATFDSDAPFGVYLAAVEGGVALTWRETSSTDNKLRSRVAAVRRDDSVSTATLDDGGHRTSRQPFVAALPNGAIGHLISMPRFAAPHHGSSRVMMRVAGAALPAKPEAPRLTGEVRNGRVRLAWTAPPQDIAGYRLEYRVGDGSWNEFDEWLEADEDQVTVLWELRKGIVYQFRIRALNDAGASAYSVPVVLNVPKRRSVR